MIPIPVKFCVLACALLFPEPCTHICFFWLYCENNANRISINMKVKVLSRNPDDYIRETKKDIHKGKSVYYRPTNV